MIALYSDPQWSTNVASAVSRLSGPGIELTEALIVLAERAKDGRLSLTDLWGALTSVFIMKQVRLKEQSGVGVGKPTFQIRVCNNTLGVKGFSLCRIS